MLRPEDILLPNRQKLGGDQLEECYRELSKKVDKYLTTTSAGICLITDGRSNVKNEPIVNYMASSPSKTFSLESVFTGEQAHSGDWIAGDISRVFSCFDKTPFVGAVMDNTKANKKAWAILREKYPTMFFQGCTSHGLHLIVKDIFAATETKKGRFLEPTYTDGFPFESLVQFAISCKDIAKFFHNHHVVKAKLSGLQKLQKLPALAKQAPTRWGSIQQCFESVLKSEHILHSIVNQRDFVSSANTVVHKAERERIKGIIDNSKFRGLVTKSLAILEPIDALIVKYQSDAVPVLHIQATLYGSNSYVATQCNPLPLTLVSPGLHNEIHSSLP
jgi:Protein of unknown function (DUF 659)